MFGHDQDEDKKQDSTTISPTADSDTADPSSDSSAEDLLSEDKTPDDDQSQAITPEPLDDDSTKAVDDTSDDSAAGTDDSTTETPAKDSEEDTPSATEDKAPTSLSTDRLSSSPIGQDDNGDLLELKKEALEELAPLVDKLDQSPEERFKTTMMMIQATDDSSLVKSAYDAAKNIENEKSRAQALLDIVNEINYFTQQHNAE